MMLFFAISICQRVSRKTTFLQDPFPHHGHQVHVFLTSSLLIGYSFLLIFFDVYTNQNNIQKTVIFPIVLCHMPGT